MGQIVTTDDVVTQALWMAGENTDGTSDYNAQALTHAQTVYNTFINGGTLGVRDVAQAAGLYEHLVDIPTTDWYWLRKVPPFAFVTTPAILGAGTGLTLNQGTLIGTVSLVYGSPTITFSIAPTVSVAGFRLKILTQASGVPNPPITVPRISAHTANSLTATIDTNWNQESQVATNYVLFQAEYPLPADFVRFVESPQVQGGWGGGNPPRLAVGSYEQVNDLFPLTEFNQGPPSAAARLDPATIMMNRWDTFSYRIEFSYLFTPPVLATGVSQQPLIPLRYRHGLAVGAAMLLAQDKTDARKNDLASEFREIIHRMGIEYRHEQKAGSEWSGRHLYRQGQTRRSMLRTTSGLPLF